MATSGTLLFVSGNHELHQVMETLRSTYGFALLLADRAKEGFDLIKVAEPDCIVFDLRLLRDQRHIDRVKERIKAARVPVLFLSDNGSGVRRSNGSQSSVRLEPIVKFVAEQSERLKKNSSGRGWLRFFRRPKAEHV